MVRNCSSCGTLGAPDARFCRHCGAVLKAAAPLGSGGETISPLAQTVPLSGEALTTSGLSADEAGGSASDTRRVGRTEMERLLQRSRRKEMPDSARDGDGSATDNSDYAAPPTGELTLAAPTPTVATAPAATAAPARAGGEHAAQEGSRPRRPWALMTGLLLLATLGASLLAFYFLRQQQQRQRAPESAGDVTPAPNYNQTAEPASVNANSAIEEAEAGGASDVSEPATTAEETPKPSPRPGVSPETPRDVRARQERERAGGGEELLPAPLATPTPLASATPIAQATTTPAPKSAEAGNNAPVPSVDPNAFYFQAVNVINARDPRTLSRAELLRALQLFQNVKSGTHAADAGKQADRLGRELDRRNRQKQR